jgi:hypothetical protein
MALPFATDLLTLFNVDEFAVSVTYSGGTIRGIFDNETVPVDAGGFVSVHQEQPRLTCRTTDVPSIAEDQTMVISGLTYRVRAWIHDGTGVTVVQLEKQ